MRREDEERRFLFENSVGKSIDKEINLKDIRSHYLFYDVDWVNEKKMLSMNVITNSVIKE